MEEELASCVTSYFRRNGGYPRRIVVSLDEYCTLCDIVRERDLTCWGEDLTSWPKGGCSLYFRGIQVEPEPARFDSVRLGD